MSPSVLTGDNRALAVLLLLAAVQAGRAAPLWPRPVPGGEQLDSAWQRTLNLLWGETKDRIGFCVGRSQWKLQRLAALSFPWPLPVATGASDALCSNSSRIDLHLCDPLEIKQYYKVGACVVHVRLWQRLGVFALPQDWRQRRAVPRHC